MKQVCKLILYLFCVAIVLTGCRDKVQSKAETADSLAAVGQRVSRISKSKKKEDMRQYDVADRQRITDFIPKGYKLFEKISGDLNKDGLDDCVLIIKATRKDGFVKNSFDKVVDRNRRGIIILFTEKNGYKLASKNYNCFSSENEEGGVYYAPELWVEERKGNLYLRYCHGRYGYWEYCFRYQGSDFMLIGYEATYNHGPLVLGKTSINFLTGVEYDDENINADKFDADSDDDPVADEVFKRTVVKLKKKPLMKLSEIEDFDELRFE